MASSGSTFSSASSSSSRSVTFFGSVPSLKDLATTQLVSQLGSVQAIEEFILQYPYIDMQSMLGDALERLQSQVHTFLQHVVRGEQKEAEEIIKANPLLLLSKGIVADYSDRIIEGTAFQIALGAEDVRYHENEECMAEMIQRYLKQLPDGEEEIKTQIQEQFPEGWENEEALRAENDLAALNRVINAISAAPANDNCEAALNEFREYLKPKDVIKSGKHFNVQLLVEAFKLFPKNYGSLDEPKNNLYWCKVIGYIQRFLPASYAQAFAQGIYNIVEENEELRRSLKFLDKISFFPLDSDPASRLGFDFNAGILCGYRTWGGEPVIPSRIFAVYVRQKTSTLQELMQ